MWDIYKIRSMHLNTWTDKKALMILVDHGRTTDSVLRRLHHPLCFVASPCHQLLLGYPFKRDQSCGISIPITHRSSTILFPGLWLKPTGLFQSPEVVSSLIISCLTMHLTLLHYHGHSNFCSDAVSTWHGGTAATSTSQSHFLSEKNDLGESEWTWFEDQHYTDCWGIHSQTELFSVRFSVHVPRKKQTNLIWCWIMGS